MSEIVKLAYNATTAKIFTENQKVKNIVSDALSYYVEGTEYMSSFKSGKWDGRSSFYSQIKSTFPAGFAPIIHDKLIAKGYRVQMIRAKFPEPLGPENPIVDEFGNDNPDYDFQLQSLRQIEKHGRGVIQIATGGGKSKIAKLIIARYRRMTLFLTTRSVLMHQMKDSCEEAGLKVGVIGDGIFAPVKGLNVGMVQTFIAKLKETTLEAERLTVVEQITRKDISLSKEEITALAKKQYEDKTKERLKIIKLLGMFEVVIGEEAHEAGGTSYFNILQYCTNANIRAALTATPFMRTEAEDNMRLMAAFGPILIQISEETLIKRGILAKPYFKFVNYIPHSKLRKTSPWQRAYQLGIMEASDRNQKILHYAGEAVKHGLPVMVLIQRTSHGKDLQKLLSTVGKCIFIRGENDHAERKRALTQLKNGKVNIVIGTTILDVGVDVPAVGMVILAGGGKAEIALRQRVGRGLRAKKTGPNVAFIVDFNDGVNSHLREHAQQRRAIIEGTPGFADGVLGDHEDFDWSIFPSSKLAA
jgi:superfamily II DNA or RNA helicase